MAICWNHPLSDSEGIRNFTDIDTAVGINAQPMRRDKVSWCTEIGTHPAKKHIPFGIEDSNMAWQIMTNWTIGLINSIQFYYSFLPVSRYRNRDSTGRLSIPSARRSRRSASKSRPSSADPSVMSDLAMSISTPTGSASEIHVAKP